MRLSGTAAFANDVSGICTKIITLAPLSLTGSYVGLANFFPLLAGVRDQYARFMITRVVVQAVPVTPATNGGYVAVGYQPDDANTSGPPVSIADVTSALHSDVAQVTEIAAIELNASEYFNDWRQCTPVTGSATAISQAGVVQLWAANFESGTSNPVVLMHIEVDIHFAGFRKLS